MTIIPCSMYLGQYVLFNHATGAEKRFKILENGAIEATGFYPLSVNKIEFIKQSDIKK